MAGLSKRPGLAAGSEDPLLSTRGTNQLTSQSQPAEDFDRMVTKKQPTGSLRVLTNCTHPFVSLDILTNGDRDVLLTFSALGDTSVRHMTPLTCHVHLTSPPRDVISVVLLEHSLCGGSDGEVIILLWDKANRSHWDVCSAWQTPGPDFVTSSNVADVTIELMDAIYPCDLNISIRAIEKPQEGQLELRYLSASEGKASLFIHVIFLVYFFAGPGLSAWKRF